jgi:type IV pilus assembly protein PilB
MAQRLVRRVCPACKSGYLVAPEAAQALGWKGEGNLKLMKGRGCPACYDSGYKGRLGIYELLEVGPPLQKMIVANTAKDEMAKHVAATGHRDLYADGIARAFAGDTTPEEIARVVHSL